MCILDVVLTSRASALFVKKKVGVSGGTVGTSPDGEGGRRAGNQEVRFFCFFSLLMVKHFTPRMTERS